MYVTDFNSVVCCGLFLVGAVVSVSSLRTENNRGWFCFGVCFGHVFAKVTPREVSRLLPR